MRKKNLKLRWQQFWYSHKKAERDLGLFCVGFLLVLIQLLIMEYFIDKSKPNFSWTFLAELLKSLGTACLTAALCDRFLDTFFSTINDKQVALAELLGVSVERLQANSSNNKTVAIVLPSFPHQNTQKSNTDPGGSKKHLEPILDSKRASAIKDFNLAPSGLAVDDITAVRHIIATFAEIQLYPPHIEYDEDVYDSWDSDGDLMRQRRKDEKSPDLPVEKITEIRNYAVLIVIGLYSNNIVQYISDSAVRVQAQCYFGLGSNELFHNNFRAVALCDQQTPLEEWGLEKGNRQQMLFNSIYHREDRLHNERPENDYAIIAKCKAPDTNIDQSILVIGGLQARGTRKAAKHLKFEWFKLHKKYLNSKYFVEVYRVPKKSGKKLSEVSHRKAGRVTIPK